MTENKAIEWLQCIANMKLAYDRAKNSRKKACEIAIKALKEIQQYRAIGTVEDIQLIFSLCKDLERIVKQFESIGTIEEFKRAKEMEAVYEQVKWKRNIVISQLDEFKALKEKNTPMELAEHNFQDEVHHYLCPSCRNIVGCNQNYCEECGQALET